MNTIISFICTLIGGCLGIALGTCFILCIRRALDLWSEKINLEQQMEYLKIDYKQIHKVMDDIVDLAGTTYKIEHSKYNGDGQVMFTKEDMKDMLEFMIKEVIYYITPSVESSLKMIVNIETEEDLIQYVTKKVKLYVLNYSIELKKET